MSDNLLEFNTFVGTQVTKWGYTFDVDELGLIIWDATTPDEGPLALLHHAGDGLIEVVYFQDSNILIPSLPKPKQKSVFMGDPGWEGKIKELILASKRAFAEGADGHQKRD